MTDIFNKVQGLVLCDPRDKSDLILSVSCRYGYLQHSSLTGHFLSVDRGAHYKLFCHFLCFSFIEIEMQRSQVTEFSGGRCGNKACTPSTPLSWAARLISVPPAFSHFLSNTISIAAAFSPVIINSLFLFFRMNGAQVPIADQHQVTNHIPLQNG